MLELRKVEAAYGRARVLFGLDLQARAGEVTALIGRNGAGKTAALKTAMGILPCAAGEILFFGESIKSLEPFETSRLGLGYVPEDRRIFSALSVAENLETGRQAPRAEPRPHAGAPGRRDVRRRAADARHRPHADGQPARDPAR
jgi:branched-chain amino acid transport system ATP-binding protein